jgi:hypothetical protein
MISTNIFQQLKTIIVYLFVLVMLLGVIFNSLAFIIFSGKRFKKTVFSTYFRFLIITDTFSVIFMPINKILELNFDIYIEKLSNTMCKLRLYVPYVISPISGWILVVISLDRWISIANSNRCLFRNKFWFQILICVLIFGFHILFYSPILLFTLETKIEYNNLTNETTINQSCSKDLDLLGWMDAFESCIVPFALMILFTLMTICSIIILRKRSNSREKHQKLAMKKKDIKFAVVSIILNAIFLVLNSPFSLLNLFDVSIEDNSISDFVLSIRFFLYYLNFITVFFINISVNSIFRNEFFNLLKKKNIF